MASPVVSPLFSNSTCSNTAYTTAYSQNTYGNGKNSYPNANKLFLFIYTAAAQTTSAMRYSRLSREIFLRKLASAG
uniref:Uncharacterized protein n=1 Tax=Ditylenchus dipsaci TaxID=166011 RepID=A0A915EL19_9BILA